MTDLFAAAVCRELAALRPPARVLLAVSGGADSMALLEAIWSGRRRRDLRHTTFAVGHFDHRLRPDSEKDSMLVEAAAQERELAFIRRAADGIDGRGEGLEAAARKARYRALVEMARETGCGAVVTAHTATDQAETLLWRLARGSGRRGLGAMRRCRPLDGLMLLRPLLGLTREETRAYCARRHVPFNDDPTNLDARPRARLRAEVLPILERLSPGAVGRLAAAADRLRVEDAWLDRAAKRALAGRWDAQAIAALPAALRRRAILRWAAEQLGSRRRLISAHVTALERLVKTGEGEVELPADPDTRRLATISEGMLALVVRPAVARGTHRLRPPPRA